MYIYIFKLNKDHDRVRTIVTDFALDPKAILELMNKGVDNTENKWFIAELR